ncbi:MAG: hypothetical protein AAF443_01360, partial [Chlamydiota bacterium]
PHRHCDVLRWFTVRSQVLGFSDSAKLSFLVQLVTQDSMLNLNDTQPGSPDYYKQQYEQELANLPKNAEAAIIVIMTVVLFTVGAYEQAEQEQVGATMQMLQNVQGEISQMQNDFNQVGTIVQNAANVQSDQAQIAANSEKIKQDHAVVDPINTQIQTDQSDLYWMEDQGQPQSAIDKQIAKINSEEKEAEPYNEEIDSLNQQNSQLKSEIGNTPSSQKEQQEEIKYVDNAIDIAVNIENQLAPIGISPESNPFSSISQSVISDIDTIFDTAANPIVEPEPHDTTGQPRKPDTDNAQGVLNYWVQAWTTPSKGQGAGSKTNYNDNTKLQPITDAFNGMQTSVSGLNSSSGTQLQYWQGDDQQTDSLDETLMQSFMQLLSTIISGSKST